ncbi:MAG: NAD-dependent DNA ligase LigA [Thermoguttaceae bacterium]
MPSDCAAEIARLREEIARHDQKYYVEAAPEISDLQYDRLMEHLKKLEAEHPNLITPDSPTQRVGERPVEGLVQVEHRVPMLSIENTYSIDELKKYGERVAKLLPGEKIEWVVELKIDGVAIALIYENGLLTRGITRGNGRVGDDITHNVRTVKGIPLRLSGKKVPPVLEVRGEIYMTNSDLVILNEAQQAKGEPLFANTRNVTAGSVRLLDPRICAQRRLRFFAHSVGLTEGLKARTHTEFLEELRGYGIPPTPEVQCFSSFAAAVDHCEELIERLHELDFEIDGLVLKVNSFDQRERLGATSKCPRWVIAYKFEKYEATTRLNEIRVQVGKTGTITPVADLEPVELAGTTVSHASLHNADEIERKDVRVGDVVVVEKAGKIIPHIVRVEKHLRKGSLRKFVFPTACPECDTKLAKDEGGVYIRCPNMLCPAQVKERIRYFAGRNAMDIEGLGDELVNKLVDEKLVRNYGDLYRLTADDLTKLEWIMDWGEKTAKDIISEIEKNKHYKLPWFIKALSMGQIKDPYASTLAEHFGSMELLYSANLDQISVVKGIGPIIAETVHDCLHDNICQETIEELRNVGINLDCSPDTHQLQKEGLTKKASQFDLIKKLGAEEFKKRIKYYAGGVKENKKKKGIKGLGETRIDQLIDENLVRGYGDLYRITFDDLVTLKRMVKMSSDEADKQLSLIYKSKNCGLERLLNALSIPHVGNRTATLLAKQFQSMDKLMSANVEVLSNINEIGPIIAQSVYDYLHSKLGSETITDLKNLGVNMKSTSKMAKARELGVRVINEEEFQNMLN